MCNSKSLNYISVYFTAYDDISGVFWSNLTDYLFFKLKFFFIFFRELLTKELETVGLRLNKTKPNIYFKVRLLFALSPLKGA